MKKAIILLSACAMLMACTDQVEVRTVKGNYHYKTSGQVTVTESEKEPYILSLNNESGVLDVVSLHSENEVLLTFNQTNGGVYNTKGKANEKTIEFEPFKRTITLQTESTKYDTITIQTGVLKHDTILAIPVTINEVYDLTVSGRSEVYDNTLIFYLDYDGKSQSTDRVIKGKEIQMLAKKA